jgi:NDP-hexose 4-ketoreductase
MKVLIFGANGFIGKNVMRVLADKHEVHGAVREPSSQPNIHQADLLDKNSIRRTLEQVKPEVVINCSGIVDNSDASMQNIQFTTNLLEVIHELGLPVQRVIISGSAAEYGVVDKANIPVTEDAPLNAAAGYGLSKLKEERFALDFAKKHDLPVVVARIFNPIGAGMHERFLIPKLIAQVKDLKEGKRESLEVSRLDSKRDYVNIDDAARAIAVLAEQSPSQKVYNIGSGVATSNGQLLQIVIDYSELEQSPMITETSAEVEPLVAIQADVSRLQTEFQWRPQHSLEQTVKEIIDASK